MIRKRHTPASSSSAVVSGWVKEYLTIEIFFAGGFTLPELDELSRLIEAYLLHDQVIYFPRNAFSLSSSVRDLVFGLDGITVSPRQLDSDGTLSPFLTPFLTSETFHDSRDLVNFYRLASYLVNPPTNRIPQKERSVHEWLTLPYKIESQLLQAELIVSEQLQSTYYAGPEGSRLVAARVRQFGNSAAALLETFTKMRSEQLAHIQNLINPHEIEVSPPLLLAYAANSATTLDGFKKVIEEMRADSATIRIRHLIDGLAEANPAERIERATVIQDELRNILGSGTPTWLSTKEVIQSVPSLASGLTWGKLIQAAVKVISPGELIEQLTIRRHLNVLRKYHRGVPSIRTFYGDLKRIFGNLAFSEKELRDWLANRQFKSPSRLRTKKDLQKEKAFEQQTKRVIQRINRLIRRRPDTDEVLNDTPSSNDPEAT